MKKQILMMLLAIVMVCSLLPTAVFAAETHTNHCVCNGEAVATGEHTSCVSPTWTAWDGTSDIEYDANNTAYVYLSANAERTSALEIPTGYNLTLCLNGHEIKPANDFTGNAFAVRGTLVLTDCKDTGAITGFKHTSWGAGVYVYGTFIMYSGAISNNTSTSQSDGRGGGVYVDGTFIMYGGTISGNNIHTSALDGCGGGVYNYGDFRMYGGAIENNTADAKGGGVYHNRWYSSLLLSGSPVIRNNTTNNNRNNVYLDGIALTIDEHFAPTSSIGISTDGLGCFAQAAEGANISDISAYAEYFVSDKGYPIYVENNALYFGYTITDEPTSGNNYAVTVNDSTGATYQWYQSCEGEYPVTDHSFAIGGFTNGTYDSEEGEWTAYEYGGLYGYFALPMKAGDTLTVEYEGDVPFLFKNTGGFSGEYTYPEENVSPYKFSIPSDGTYMLLVPAGGSYTLKATLNGQHYIPVAQTTAALSNVPSGTYACKVIWDMGTDDAADDYVLVSEPVDYTASYTVTVTANPTAGGEVTGGGTYQEGADVALTAEPAAGYKFVNWTKGSEVVSTNAIYSITADTDVTLIANFELNSYTITATANPAGGGSVEGGGTYNHGTEVTLTATPRAGYVFVNWTENGTEVNRQTPYTFTAEASRTLVANFKHQHPICGASCTHTGEHPDIEEWTEVVKDTNLVRRSEYDAYYQLNDGKTHYYLSGNVSLNYPIKITQNTYLCLGGYELSGGVTVDNGATLYLCDCKDTGKICNNNGRGVAVNSGTFVMYRGSIANCYSPFRVNGAGVYVGSGGTFDMYGGTIKSCSTENDIIYPTFGGGVYVTGTGVFNMYNGVIDNCAANKGGGVAAADGGTFNMNGGTIQNCSIGGYNNNRGGGVYITGNGNFTMNGTAAITGCSADQGGGVYADSTAGSFTLAGGSITGCASSDHTYYGAVYLNSANMTVSGEVTIKGTRDGDLTICKGHNTNGVITFTENGELAENIRIYIEPAWVNMWSTKEDTRFIHAASDTQRNTLKSQITLYVDNGGAKTGKIYTYDETDLRFTESNGISIARNYTSWGTVTLAQGNESPITSGDCFETITVTVQPADGYDLVSLTATMNYGSEEITLVPVPGSENVFTFEMPADPAGITAKFGIIREHALCQTDNCTLNHTGHEVLSLLPVFSEAELQDAADNGGNYYLAGDISLTSTINVTSDFALCLNGYQIKPASGFTRNAIDVSDTGTLVLTDCKDTGAITGFTSSESGGGVYNDGTFTMYNGTISGNTAEYHGGGVHNDGTFTMYGGTISGNRTELDGGGVYNNGTFTMYGGTISGNRTEFDGGGVYNYYTFTMYGGIISENIADDDGGYVENDGGGVFNYGDAYIYGGTIENNTATGNGGGLHHYYNAEGLLLSGSPTISGNKVNGVDNNVYLDEILLTIDEDFAPTAPVGITVENRFGRFAEPANGANIENIAVYEQYFASEGNFPIYTQENVLYIGYKITEQPDAENGYTVKTNDDDNANFQWGTVTSETMTVVKAAEESGGPEPCSVEAEVETTVVWGGTFNEASGMWTTEVDHYDYVLDIGLPVQAGDVVKFTPVGDVSGVDIAVRVYDDGSEFDYDEESGVYTYTTTAQDNQFNPIAITSAAVSFKVEIVRTTLTPIDGQTEAALNPRGLQKNIYVCAVTWDMGTPDDPSDDYTRLSEPVEYDNPVSVRLVYSVTVKNGEDSNGTVSVSKARATSGSTITITVTPDAYYGVEKVIVSGTNGKEIAVTRNEDGTYSFKMPSCKVTVEAVFVRENPFVDVSEDAFYYDAVQWAVENGITEGTSATTFSPLDACTRAQMVTFLWRAAGCPEPTSTDCAFTDVDLNSYYGKAVLWAVENGITNGTSATTFSPDMECSRAQMAAFLCRMAGGEAESDTIAFIDVKADAYYAEPVQWAVENGITKGTGEGKYSPDDTCTRGQMVTFLYRYFVK